MRVKYFLVISAGLALVGVSLWLLVGSWAGVAFTVFFWMSFFIQALTIVPAGGGNITFLARRTGESLREGLAVLPLRGLLFDVAGATDPSKKLLKFLRGVRNYVTIFCCIIAIVQLLGHYTPSQTARPLTPAISVASGEAKDFVVPAKSLGPIVFVEGLWVLDSSGAIIVVLEDGRRIFYSPGEKIDVGRHRGSFRVLNTSRTEAVEVSIFSPKR